MKVIVLASGSSGNCVYVEGKSGAVFIDAGRTGKEILGTKKEPGIAAQAGCAVDSIQAVLVTHEHGDHIKGLGKICSNLGVTAYGTRGTLGALSNKYAEGKLPPCKSIATGDPFEVAGFTIEAFATFHDTREPCGFLLSDGDVKLGYCTDTGYVSSTMQTILNKADMLVMESNHCTDMLKAGKYPQFLKNRIASDRGHLSNKSSASAISTFSDIHSIILAHISKENNEPMLALKTAAACKNDDVHLFAASTIAGQPACIRKVGGECVECTEEAWKYSVRL
jgi:phosphoribosyl 1,2-cyclic phosphodiesterase